MGEQRGYIPPGYKERTGRGESRGLRRAFANVLGNVIGRFGEGRAGVRRVEKPKPRMPISEPSLPEPQRRGASTGGATHDGYGSSRKSEIGYGRGNAGPRKSSITHG